MSALVALAHDIEWMHATDRVKLRRGPAWGRADKDKRKSMVMAEFDAHAATELAGLIAGRLHPRPLKGTP